MRLLAWPAEQCPSDPMVDASRISGPWLCLDFFSTSLIAGSLQNCHLSQDSYDPHIDELLNTMLVAVNSILQIPLDHMQHKRDSMREIGMRLQLLASRMHDFADPDFYGKWQHINHTHHSQFDIIPLSALRI